MNRVYQKCPTCGSKECGDIRCRFTGKDHKNAAPQASLGEAQGTRDGDSPEVGPSAVAAPINAAAQERSGRTGNAADETLAAAAPDIGYECAWPR